MRIGFPKILLGQVFSARFIASLFLVVMCIQFVPLEGYGVSPIKVGLMFFSILIFFWKVPYFSKALIWGMLYWAVCYFGASFQDYMRFSTIGYLGMFILFYAVYYNLVQIGAFSLDYFVRILKGLIMVYGIVLVLQQIVLLFGVHTFKLINLNDPFWSLDKAPSLALEPSHSARLLTVMMLGYLRCLELLNDGIKPTARTLFEPEHRWVTILFLWAMLTMGSGTAFIGLGLLCLYFIQWRTAIYIVPLLAGLFFVGQALEIEQMDRALRVTRATMTGDVKEIQAEDGSAASRVVPLVNTLKIDLTDRKSWFGSGTSTYEQATTAWRRTTQKISVVEQYGLIGLIVSLSLVYSCVICYFISLETLMFVILFGMSLGNTAYVWGAMMMFTAIRYFQKSKKM